MSRCIGEKEIVEGWANCAYFRRQLPEPLVSAFNHCPIFVVDIEAVVELHVATRCWFCPRESWLYDRANQ